MAAWNARAYANEDEYEPKRFFSMLRDEQIKSEAARNFSLEEFSPVHFKEDKPFHFQSLVLRVKNRSIGQA